MTTAKISSNGQSQVENQEEVFIAKERDAVISFDSLEKFSDDFITQREQPEQQKKEDLF
ncbi:MAG: hypothetical protein WC665_00540 [Sulfurimonas sp.]|jgi:hypothetical protein